MTFKVVRQHLLRDSIPNWSDIDEESLFADPSLIQPSSDIENEPFFSDSNSNLIQDPLDPSASSIEKDTEKHSGRRFPDFFTRHRQKSIFPRDCTEDPASSRRPSEYVLLDGPSDIFRPEVPVALNYSNDTSAQKFFSDMIIDDSLTIQLYLSSYQGFVLIAVPAGVLDFTSSLTSLHHYIENNGLSYYSTYNADGTFFCGQMNAATVSEGLQFRVSSVDVISLPAVKNTDFQADLNPLTHEALLSLIDVHNDFLLDPHLNEVEIVDVTPEQPELESQAARFSQFRR